MPLLRSVVVSSEAAFRATRHTTSAVAPPGRDRVWLPMKRRRFMIGAVATAAGLLAPDASRSQSDIGPHLAVSDRGLGQAIALNFIGLSYEPRSLAGGDYFTPGNSSRTWADPIARRERRHSHRRQHE